MLKLAKWAYSLGVKQERVRIARALEGELHLQRMSLSIGHDMYSDKSSNMTEKRKSRLKQDLEVGERVGAIVEAIMRPNQEYVPGASVMFPNNDKKEK